jgi:ammonium transporter, Amt family
MHYIPGLRLRLLAPEAEIIGIDDTEMGEFAYDYVGLNTELSGRRKEVETDEATGRDWQQVGSGTTSGGRVNEDVSGVKDGREKDESWNERRGAVQQ